MLNNKSLMLMMQTIRQ